MNLSILLFLALCPIAGALPQASLLAELPKADAGSTLKDVENHLESLSGIAARQRQTLQASAPSQHSGDQLPSVRSALGRQLLQSRADGELPDFKQESSLTAADGALHHTPNKARDEYVACINAHQPGLNITTWSEAMEGEPGTLQGSEVTCMHGAPTCEACCMTPCVCNGAAPLDADVTSRAALCMQTGSLQSASTGRGGQPSLPLTSRWVGSVQLPLAGGDGMGWDPQERARRRAAQGLCELTPRRERASAHIVPIRLARANGLPRCGSCPAANAKQWRSLSDPPGGHATLASVAPPRAA